MFALGMLAGLLAGDDGEDSDTGSKGKKKKEKKGSPPQTQQQNKTMSGTSLVRRAFSAACASCAPAVCPGRCLLWACLSSRAKIG
jgi:hypothetical protein